jgi:hypothetical protein
MKVNHIVNSFLDKFQIFSNWFWFGFIVWTISFFAPYLINGLDSYIRIHDTLEGELGWFNLLEKSGHLHSLSNQNFIDTLMNGLPRNVLPSGYVFFSNMLYVFGTFYGYIFATFIYKSIGFISFYLFVKKYMTISNLNEIHIVTITLLITSIQFFPQFGLSVVGIPLLSFGFARLYYRKGIKTTMFIMFLFPFFSNFVLCGIEMIILMTLAIIVVTMIDKSHTIDWFLAYFAYILGNFIANIQFLNGMLFLEGFRSHRVSYNTIVEMPNFSNTISEFFSFFLSTHYHVSIFISLLILVVFMISYHGIEKNKWARNIMIGITVIVGWQALYPFIEFLLRDIAFIKSFHFNRFGFVLPFLWLILLIISLDIISREEKLKRWVSLIIFSQFLILFFANDETAHNYKRIIGKDNFPSYREYFAKETFIEIQQKLNIQKQDKILSICLSPSIAQFNGFSTLDGLFSVYDLSYKEKFRKIFEKELEKVDWKRRSYFDNWGNRCYVFPAEVPLNTVSTNLAKKDSYKLHNLEINSDAIRELGGKYIFSASEILNYHKLKIKPLGKFGEGKYWKIYVYGV